MKREEDEHQGGDGFKIEDRRLFTPDGKLREGAGNSPKPPRTAGSEPRKPSEGRPATHPAFVHLVEFLAGNALLSLGAGPEGSLGPPVDIRAARSLTEMLDVLRERTRGRVSEDEERLIEERLYELQMVFVEKSRPAGRR